MNGNSILLDTNTVLYLLGGKISTDFLPEGVYYISFITELELLSYPNISETESNTIQQFINGIDEQIKNVTEKIEGYLKELGI